MTSVPLHEVLPPDYLGAVDDLRRLAHDLDSHPSAVGRIAWHWYPGTEPPQVGTGPGETAGEGGVYLLLVDTAITLYDTRADWLELTLDIAWSPAARLTVDATVGVACWCPRDHNMHRVRRAQRQVATSSEMVAAFAAGTAMLVDVLGSGPFEPHPWRIQAGLPNPPETAR
jgi:hypothetical protein